jgi:hypothetical protein
MVTPSEQALVEALADVSRHDGQPRDPDADFFVPPPAEIGLLVSAHSTLSRQEPKHRTSLSRRLAVAMYLCAGVLFLTALALPFVQLVPAAYLLVFLSFLSAICARWIQAPSYVCTYVGRDGLARYRCRGDRANLVEESVLSFQAARALRTNHPAANEYPPTAADWYGFVWFDATGRILFRISGWWLGPHGPADQTFHFGVAGEEAWTLFRLNGSAGELVATGRVHFSLALGGTLRLGRGVLELEAFGQMRSWDRKQQPVVVSIDRLLRLHFGLVNVRGDAVGHCALPLREASDARLVLLLLRTLVLFDLPAVEGAESHWGGRTFTTSSLDQVTTDPRVTAFRERIAHCVQAGRVPSEEQT